MTEYDRTDIPDAYDRGRDHGPQVLDLWMRTFAAYLEGPSARIVDLGCGTGRFADALSVHFNAEVVAVDPSVKMLRQALTKPHGGRVHYVRASAEAIPLQSESIDAIVMSMSLHHFSDQAAAAAECRRVLHDDGRVFIRTGTREQIRAYPYYPFFPTSHPILEEVLPDSGSVCRLFEAAGLHRIAQVLVTQTIAPDWATFADKLASRADSVLARLDREDFERGVAAVRQYAEGGKSEPVIEPIDLFVFHRGARTSGVISAEPTRE